MCAESSLHGFALTAHCHPHESNRRRAHELLTHPNIKALTLMPGQPMSPAGTSEQMPGTHLRDTNAGSRHVLTAAPLKLVHLLRHRSTHLLLHQLGLLERLRLQLGRRLPHATQAQIQGGAHLSKLGL